MRPRNTIDREPDIALELLGQEDKIWMITPQPLKAALLFVSVGPIVPVYPFLQRYFVTGIMPGSAKG